MLTRFFGDAEREFGLTPILISELERKTGKGIGMLCGAVASSEFALADLSETIRLAMIGGGASPNEAKALTDTYVAARPLNETHALAADILNALWIGAEAVGEQKVNPDEPH